MYGKKSASSGGVPIGPNYGTTTASPPSEEDSELCTDPKVDTMFNSAEGHMYAFKGTYSFELVLKKKDNYTKRDKRTMTIYHVLFLETMVRLRKTQVNQKLFQKKGI